MAACPSAYRIAHMMSVVRVDTLEADEDRYRASSGNEERLLRPRGQRGVREDLLIERGFLRQDAPVALHQGVKVRS